MTKEDTIKSIVTVYKLMKDDLDGAIKQLSLKIGRNDVMEVVTSEQLRKILSKTRKIRKELGKYSLLNVYNPDKLIEMSELLR